MEDLAKEINESIKSSDVYKKYLSCKKTVDNNEELCFLKNRMEELKKINCVNKEEDLIDEYYRLESEYKNNLLVKEYERAKSDVYDLLVEVCDILWFK